LDIPTASCGECCSAAMSDNRMGWWEGDKFLLREFPAAPAKGTVKGVEYSQTMGRITLKYALPEPVAGLTAKDLKLDLSSWELRVKVEGNRELSEHFSPLCGDLHGHIRRDLSWWTLEKEDDQNIITIELAKRDHKAWSAVWKVGMKNHRKQHFALSSGSKTPLKKAEEIAVKVKAGKPSKSEREPFVINREYLCVGVDEGQDSNMALIRIHLEKDALAKACEKVPLAHLFSVDVMDKYLKIFIRGDEKSPIMMGQLGGKCIPEKTTWEFVKARQDEGPQAGSMGTAIQVKLIKSEDSRTEWPRLLFENELMAQREAAPQVEELQKRGYRKESPDRTNWTPKEHAVELKTKGDGSFKKSEWRDASVFYTRAINHTPEDVRLYSNRAACFLKLKKFEKALEDAIKSITIDQTWTKAYFRQGQALRGLQQFEDAKTAFAEGKFRDPSNPDWEKEIRKTDEEQEMYEEQMRQKRKEMREADQTAELNEATTVAERQAMVAVAEQAIRAGKDKHEAGQLALKGAEMAKKQVHEMAEQRRKQAEAMMVEDDKELDKPPPYRIVKEDGSVHAKGFSHTEKGSYFMGMVMMNYQSEPWSQPWIEIWRPAKIRWSQGCARLKIKVFLPESVKNAHELEVTVTAGHLRVGTYGNSDAIVEGDFERKVEPEGENFAWYVIPDEKPPVMEMILDKDQSEIYQTFSYGILIWQRLFYDDVLLGEGLFEADLTDLPEHLLKKFQREQARTNLGSVDERTRRGIMTEEEIGEETARNWNDEFARYGMPHRVDTNEEKFISNLKYGGTK